MNEYNYILIDIVDIGVTWEIFSKLRESKFSAIHWMKALIHANSGKFAEVSDPTVGVDFFARLVQVDEILYFLKKNFKKVPSSWKRKKYFCHFGTLISLFLCL